MKLVWLEIVGYRAKKEHIAHCTREILAVPSPMDSRTPTWWWWIWPCCNDLQQHIGIGNPADCQRFMGTCKENLPVGKLRSKGTSMNISIKVLSPHVPIPKQIIEISAAASWLSEFRADKKGSNWSWANQFLLVGFPSFLNHPFKSANVSIKPIDFLSRKTFQAISTWCCWYDIYIYIYYRHDISNRIKRRNKKQNILCCIPILGKPSPCGHWAFRCHRLRGACLPSAVDPYNREI